MKILSIFLLLLSFNCFSSELPIASDLEFEKGQIWEWSYYNTDGEIYSVERYKLINIEVFQLNKTLWFEMSTSHQGKPFEAHHQFTVNLRDCYRSHSSQRQRQGFNIKMYPIRNGRLGSPTTVPSTAFEEKFNCNGHIYQNNWRYETSFGSLYNPIFGQRDTFSQKDKIRRGAQLTGAYDIDSGIMLKKVFNPNTANEYTSILTGAPNN